MRRGWRIRLSQVDDRTGEGAGDALHRLDLGNNQLAEVVDRPRFGLDDDVVGTGHIVRSRDAGDAVDLLRDLRRLPHFGLDQDVRLHLDRQPAHLPFVVRNPTDIFAAITSLDRRVGGTR